MWWYKFCFAGQFIRESSKSTSKTIARDAENQRRRELEQGYHNLRQKREIRIRLPMCYRRVAARLDGALWERVIESVPEDMGRWLVASIQDASPSNEAIQQAVQSQIAVPGAEVCRGDHLRVA